MEADLHQIVRSGQPLSNLHIQFFIYQLLRGMKYIHSANVIHRDLKPGNLLVNADCELKICDFGLARGFRPVPGEAGMHEGLKLTEYVATRWYRAPEIMLSNKRYTTAMDVWSIGCILGELLGGKPMFKGKDYVDQLNLILGILGTPDDETLESMSSEKARMYVRTLRYSEPVPLATMLPDADPQALDLLGQLLAFDPTKRIDVVTALDHPYVAAYHDLDDEPECEVFDKWEEVEKLQTLDELREALTNEITEYRAEVRGLAQMELEEGIANGEYTYAYEDEDGEEVDVDVEVAEPAEIEVEPELLPEDQVTSPSRHGRPAIVDTTNVPDSPCERTGSPVRTKLGLAAAAGRSPTLSPRRPRQSSPYAPRTPRTPRTPGEEGARTRHTRRSSSQSAHRRSMSFLFGSGLAMSSLAMTPAAGAPGSGAITSGESTATAGTAGTAGAMTGPRSRAPSAAGADFSSLGPIIRQLSTTNLADMGNALTDDEPLMTEGSDDGHIVIGRGRRGSRPRGPE
jgi:mitogen-activated protein kinase 7